MNRFIYSVRALIDQSASKVSYEHGQLPADDWRVVNPAYYEAIENSAIQLCEQTRQWIEDATGQQADKIIQGMRKDILGNQKAGKTVLDLTNELAKYFDSAVRWKARQIARTEAIRAHNTGYLIATANEDFVLGYEWIVSTGACDWCKEVGAVGDRGRRIKKGDLFYHNPKAASSYRDVICPPLHPNCMCQIISVLEIDDPKPEDWDGQYGATPPTPKPQIIPPAPTIVIQPTPTPVPIAKPTVPVIAAPDPVAIPDKPKPARKPRAKKVPPVESVVFPEDLSGLETVKQLGGSTGAVLVKDKATGILYVKKTGASPEHLRNEVHADDLYRAFGVNVPDSRIYETGGGPVKLSKYLEDAETLSDLRKRSRPDFDKAIEKVKKDYAVDAMLGNWDVLGLGGDNVMVDKNGEVWRIDNGGALGFRAQGQKKNDKQWSDYPVDLWSIVDDRINATKAPEWIGDVDWMKAVDDLPKKTPALPRSVPQAIRDRVEKRIGNAREAYREAEILIDDSFQRPYVVDHFTRASMALKNEKLFDGLPNQLQIDFGGFGELYSNGVNYLSRLQDGNKDGPYKRFLDYVEKTVPNWGDHIREYMEEQAQSSWFPKPIAYKFHFTENILDRKKGFDHYYWGSNTETEVQNEYRKSFPKISNANEVIAYQHAYTYNLLRNLPLPTKSPDNNRISLNRMISDQEIDGNGNKIGQNDITSKRGPLESFGFATVFHSKIATYQSVPIHRVFASYLQGRSRFEKQAFLGDRESEFLVIGSSDIKYDIRNKPRMPYDKADFEAEMMKRAKKTGTRADA